jgi:hypothetical protein
LDYNLAKGHNLFYENGIDFFLNKVGIIAGEHVIFGDAMFMEKNTDFS